MCEPVSVEAFDIFSQGEMSEGDSCGVCFVDSDCVLGAWSTELVSSSVCVPSSFAVEVVGDTNGLNHGPVWKIQSFFLSGIFMVILWQDCCGKGKLRKSY